MKEIFGPESLMAAEIGAEYFIAMIDNDGDGLQDAYAEPDHKLKVRLSEKKVIEYPVSLNRMYVYDKFHFTFVVTAMSPTNKLDFSDVKTIEIAFSSCGYDSSLICRREHDTIDLGIWFLNSYTYQYSISQPSCEPIFLQKIMDNLVPGLGEYTKGWLV